ncbi:MAG TPA: lipase family protein, partial [Prolixibacteraceae bacterium]
MRDLSSRRFFLIILCTVLFLQSCKDVNDPTPVKTDYQFLVSNELKLVISAPEIKFKLGVAQNSYPQITPFVALVKNDIDVQKIIYTTTFQNQNIQASGLVCLPKVSGSYPVLCFQNGTNTQQSMAPSVYLNSDMLFMLESVASMGFIVVIPDYIGFGASSNLPHPYLHAQSTTQSILDMLRAMNELTTEDNIAAKPTKDLFIYGYSQGGWATMLLQKEIETRYSSEFNLIASSCAAGPYSLEYMNKYITGKTDYPMPYFLTYVLNAYTSIGLVPNPLSDFIQAPYAALIPGLYNGTKSGSTINSELTTNMADLLTSEYRDQYATNPKFSALTSAFIDNSVKPWAMSTPTRLYHGTKDELIPPGMSEKTLVDLKAAGTSDSKIQLILL